MNEYNGLSKEAHDESQVVFCDCYSCGDSYDVSDTVTSDVDGEIRCDACYSETHSNCCDCNDEDLEEDMMYLESHSGWVCQSCGESYVECVHCDWIEHEDNMFYSGSDGGLVCEDCHDSCTTFPTWEVHSNEYVSNFSGFVEIKDSDYFGGNSIIESRRSMGVEIETNFEENIGASELQEQLHNELSDDKMLNDLGRYSNDYVGINVVYDGSTTNSEHEFGLEAILSPRRRNLLIHDIKVVANKMKYDNNAYLSSKCGYHLHVDSRDYDWYHFAVLTLMTKLVEPHIYSWNPASRSGGRWCMPVSQSCMSMKSLCGRDDLIDWYYDGEQYRNDKYHEKRYHGLNLHSHFQANQGVEIRYHSGTLNPDKMKHWSVLWSCIIDKCYEIGCDLRQEMRVNHYSVFGDTKLYKSLTELYTEDEINKISQILRETEDSERNRDGYIKINGDYIINESKVNKILSLDKSKMYSLPSLCNNYSQYRRYLTKPCLTINSVFDMFDIPTETQDFYRMRSVEINQRQSPLERVDDYNHFKDVSSFWTFEDNVFKVKDLLSNRIPNINILDEYDSNGTYAYIDNNLRDLSDYIIRP